MFDWCATQLYRQAQSGEPDDRKAVYIMVRDRARVELGRMPGSAAAAYWLVSAYRSLGDMTKAWDAAVAGWVRAPFGEDQGRALRADLDQLVLLAIIPELVRVMASNDRDRDRAATSMRAEWDGIKKDWATKRP